MDREKISEKIGSLLKEELWGRIEPRDIGISKFKILDDLFNSIVSENLVSESLESCTSHLNGHPDSITAGYLVGLIGHHLDNMEFTVYLRKLIDIFSGNHKWAVVEILAEKILEYGESSIALRALAVSLERLGRSRDAIPVFESLLKIDRFDAEVAKKLAFAIIDTDPGKSIYYMKLSIEGFIKNGLFDEVAPLWNKLVSISRDDVSFFERVVRLLVDAKEFDLTASLLKVLLNSYKAEENPDRSIDILKKILEYKPEDSQARKELMRLYRIKYGTHSQFEQFIKLSRLNNFKSPVKFAIQDFEKNIVFDRGNYAFHGSWGLGNILDIDNDRITISFKDKPEHKMSIQMALQSLKPVGKDHFYVMEYVDPEDVTRLFNEDFMQFFGILIKSYGGVISLTDIKNELIPKYIDAKNWAKFWNRARTEIKKNPLFGVSDKKKDTIFMREKPLTFVDELLDSFTKVESFSEKLDIAIEFINNIGAEEGISIAQYFIDYFTEESRGKSATRQILSYFILKDLAKYSDPAKLKLEPIRARIIEFIKESAELPLISIKISSYDYKKDFVNLIEEAREDWPRICAEFLFETPIRIHKYIFNSLIRSHSYNLINGYIDRVITGARQYPELMIWVAKNLFSGVWIYDWLDYSRRNLIISYFRLMNELKKIETDGNRLKNMILDLLFDNDAEVLNEIIEQSDRVFLGRIYDLFKNVSYIEESHLDKFFSLIKGRYSDFQGGQSKSEVETDIDVEKLMVSRRGFEKMKAELDRLVNVDMVNTSRELSKVSEASGDLRENVEYNALMEKQTILKLTISKLDAEIKKADVIEENNVSTEAVNIGTKVILEDGRSGVIGNFIILGPWEADFEKKILSYRSPIAKSLLGKKTGEEVRLRIDDEDCTFVIRSIEKFIS